MEIGLRKIVVEKDRKKANFTHSPVSIKPKSLKSFYDHGEKGEAAKAHINVRRLSDVRDERARSRQLHRTDDH